MIHLPIGSFKTRNIICKIKASIIVLFMDSNVNLLTHGQFKLVMCNYCICIYYIVVSQLSLIILEISPAGMDIFVKI